MRSSRSVETTRWSLVRDRAAGQAAAGAPRHDGDTERGGGADEVLDLGRGARERDRRADRTVDGLVRVPTSCRYGPVAGDGASTSMCGWAAARTWARDMVALRWATSAPHSREPKPSETES